MKIECRDIMKEERDKVRRYREEEEDERDRQRQTDRQTDRENHLILFYST